MSYRTYHQACRERFGCKVYKLAISGGFTCPNRDGTIGTGGCIFCSEAGGGEFVPPQTDIRAQLESARKLVESKTRDGKFIAYFQSFTGTYGPVSLLQQRYMEAIEPEYVVGLNIGTRPDCLGPEVIALLKQINAIKPVCVELGLQTVNEATAAYIRRGYGNSVYFRAMRALKDAGIETVTHIIIGLPGENARDAVETTRAAVAAGTDGVKFHLLHVLRGTDLEKDYLAGKFRCLELEEYGRILKACIGCLLPRVVVHRITGDGARRNLVAPLWSTDKKRVLNYLNRVLQEK